MKKWIVLIFTLGANWQYAVAAPNITTVTSTGTSQWAKITVSGSAFGTKSPAPPLYFWPEGSPSRNPHPFGQNSSWDDINGAISVISSGIVHGGVTNLQLKLNFLNCNTSNNFRWFFQMAPGVGGKIIEFVDRYKTTVELNPTNIKLHYYWSSGFVDPSFLQSFNESQNFCYVQGGANTWASKQQGSTPASNIWNVERTEFSTGSLTADATTGNGHWRSIRNGVLNQFGDDMPTLAGTHSIWWLTHEFAGSGNCPADTTAEYELWKNIYMDNTYSQVLISSADAGGTCTAISTGSFIRPAPALTWSGTSITAYLNLFQINTANGVCVTMRDVNGTTSNTVFLNTGVTNLSPSLGTITTTSMVASWSNVGTSQIGVLATDSGFTSIVSSGTETTPKTYGSLTCNTQYWFEVKVSSEGDGGYSSTNATTSACPVGTAIPSTGVRGSAFQGVNFR